MSRFLPNSFFTRQMRCASVSKVSSTGPDRRHPPMRRTASQYERRVWQKQRQTDSGNQRRFSQVIWAIEHIESGAELDVASRIAARFETRRRWSLINRARRSVRELCSSL